MAENVPQVGRLIRADEQVFRDAIHTPLAPLEAAEWIPVGWHFYLENGKAMRGGGSDAERGRDGRTIGVVDPLLEGEGVEKGQRFYGWIYPGTVEGLRHQWRHKAFAPQGSFDRRRVILTKGERVRPAFPVQPEEDERGQY